MENLILKSKIWMINFEDASIEYGRYFLVFWSNTTNMIVNVDIKMEIFCYFTFSLQIFCKSQEKN